MTGNALVPKSSVFWSLKREVLWHVDITWYMKFDKLWCLPWWTQKHKAAAVLGNAGGRLRGRASQHDISVTSYAIATQLLWNHTEPFTAATAAFILAGGCCARIWSWKPPACLRVHQVSCLERYTDPSFCWSSEELPWNVQVQVRSRASLGVQFEWTGTASMRRRFLNCLSSRTVFREDLAVESQLECVCRPPLKDIDPEFFPGLRAKPWCLEPDLWKSLLSLFDGSCHFIFFNILAFVASGLRWLGNPATTTDLTLGGKWMKLTTLSGWRRLWPAFPMQGAQPGSGLSRGLLKASPCDVPVTPWLHAWRYLGAGWAGRPSGGGSHEHMDSLYLDCLNTA